LLVAYSDSIKGAGDVDLAEFLGRIAPILAKNPVLSLPNSPAEVVKVIVGSVPSEEELAALAIQLIMNPKQKFHFVIGLYGESGSKAEAGITSFEEMLERVQTMFDVNRQPIGKRINAEYALTEMQLVNKTKNTASGNVSGNIRGDFVTILDEAGIAGRLVVTGCLGAVVNVPKPSHNYGAARNFAAMKLALGNLKPENWSSLGVSLIKELGPEVFTVNTNGYFDMHDEALRALVAIWQQMRAEVRISVAA